ncbi:Tripartite-type tricarboxylate transporter, receptor component TctC [Alteribacillus persepolensis]|uniref:Tripartite-type tricarboxylate transporter, receptor component TctC n=1 Tax=Alteribacillus persepolensis TaxID=568899 RepID=A0A1G8B072_9BACI|nr:tripartite tricarboxylate transporter substrate binding protein [Alteribacillus persepolensis]SDH26534.1 Tripartite-type tricarboxylate transporter, receptor component TctC [Alteribacillus persepolensis]
MTWKKKTKKLASAVLLTPMLFLAACGGQTDTEMSESDIENYPERDIRGVIQWGEGGATDNISRTLAPLAEEELGGTLVMENREGASGATGAQYVYDQPADGYTLLFGAENPNGLYQVLGISERDYLSDFQPVSIIGQSYAGIVVNKDSEFDTLEELADYASDNPGDITMGTSGEGGLPYVASAMLSAELGTEFNQVPYDGDGPLATALLSEEIDATVLAVSAAQEYVDSGDFKMLAVINDERLESVPDAPALTEAYPEFEKYLPWGPFQGVFAHKDTPDAIIDKLTEAFAAAQEDEQFQTTLENLGVQPLNIHGEEAIEYLEQNRSTSTWMLYDAGATDTSPEEFDIPRVDEE